MSAGRWCAVDDINNIDGGDPAGWDGTSPAVAAIVVVIIVVNNAGGVGAKINVLHP